MKTVCIIFILILLSCCSCSSSDIESYESESEQPTLESLGFTLDEYLDNLTYNLTLSTLPKKSERINSSYGMFFESDVPDKYIFVLLLLDDNDNILSISVNNPGDSHFKNVCSCILRALDLSANNVDLIFYDLNIDNIPHDISDLRSVREYSFYFSFTDSALRIIKDI